MSPHSEKVTDGNKSYGCVFNASELEDFESILKTAYSKLKWVDAYCARPEQDEAVRSKMAKVILEAAAAGERDRTCLMRLAVQAAEAS